MAKCSTCGKKGLFVRVNQDKRCKLCESAHQEQLREIDRLRVEESKRQEEKGRIERERLEAEELAERNRLEAEACEKQIAREQAVESEKVRQRTRRREASSIKGNFTELRFWTKKWFSTILRSFTVIDVETTGLNPAVDRIIEIGAIKFLSGVESGKFLTLVNPLICISPGATAVNHITDDMVVNAPVFADVADILWEFLGDTDVFVAHNAAFDLAFLKMEFSRCGYEFSGTYLDTLSMSRSLFPSLLNHKLQTVLEKVGSSRMAEHRAEADCYGCAEIVQFALEKFRDEHPEMKSPKPVDSASPYVLILSDDIPRIHDSCEARKMLVENLKRETGLSETKAVQCNEEIVFDGSAFVFTGTIVGYSRAELEKQVQERGGRVTGGVSIKTNYVVAGLQDTAVVLDAEGAKSSKILKAEALQAEGHDVRIISADSLAAALRR